MRLNLTVHTPIYMHVCMYAVLQLPYTILKV